MRLAFCITTALGALSAALVFTSGATAGVGTPVPGLDFWIAVPDVPGCSTAGGDATCHVAPGATFVLDAYLNSSGLSYAGYDVYLQYQGVAPNHDADSYAWPDCGFPASSYDMTGVVQFACAFGINAPGSTYSGLIGTNSFICSQSGTITLVNGPLLTDLVESEGLGVVYSEDPNTSETLDIRCDVGETPSPTTTGTPSAPTPAGTPTQTAIPSFPPPEPAPAFDVTFWIAVEGVPNCTTEHGDATCELAPGTTFAVDAHLGPLPASLSTYVGFDVSLEHAGVRPLREAGGPTGGCAFDDPAVVGCAGRPRGGISAEPGILRSVRFDCVRSGYVALLHAGGPTDVIGPDRGQHAESRNGRETLRINCGPDLPSTGSGTVTRSDSFSELLTATAVCGALLVTGAWAARRRRA